MLFTKLGAVFVYVLAKSARKMFHWGKFLHSVGKEIKLDKNTENQKTGGFLQGLFHRQESERPDILIANAQKKAQKRTQNQMDIQPVDSENRTAPQLRGTSRICNGTSIKGSLTSDENLILDGEVEGLLNSDGAVVVSGSVHCDVN